LLTSYKLANLCKDARLVCVSDYSATHLRALFGIETDAVIRNPVKFPYLNSPNADTGDRNYITYVGRLVPAKNMHLLLPPILTLLRDYPCLRALVIGDGPERERLVRLANGEPRVEFKRSLSDEEVRDHLRRTKVFVSGHPTEGFGITYVEALSQGCVVAMPASGGGLEIALERIGNSVQLLPISLDGTKVAEILRRAFKIHPGRFLVQRYEAAAVASAYLEVDRRFFVETSSVTEVDSQTETHGARLS
jgi:glycosyltransferase involved in cell wall biosynthesis